ncbi:MAG: PAS domain-containing protein [Hydrogenophaga sp.]|nr:PAS domain-containing protein [Hydrogenophaga sp.]
MKATMRRLLLAMAGHRLVPLMIFLMALVSLAINYAYQMHNMEGEVEQQELERLRDRLSIEQGRLDIRLGNTDPLALRRIVGSLGLYDGLNRAYLVDPAGRVLASLSRIDTGRTLYDVVQSASAEDAPVLQGLFDPQGVSSIRVQGVPGRHLLGGQVPLLDGHRLGVLVDIDLPMTRQRLALQRELALEALWAMVAAALLALLLHLMWFRRAQRLAAALAVMGAGDLSVRTGLDGSDELALIGRAADKMAVQLQNDRAVALHMSDLVNRSPLVVIEWRYEPGWPVRYVNDNIRQWGYEPQQLIENRIRFASLLHPDDAAWVGDEVDRYLAQGPDEYRQEYRVMCADGRWVWVHDHTRQERDAQGRVVAISGILLDITERKLAQQAQREQAELLRLFYELPFIGMAITSPESKRWLQVNDRLCEILGYPREELLNLTWSEITPPEDLTRNLTLFGELLAGQRDGYEFEKRFIRKDRSLVHTEINVRAVRAPDGALQRLFTTVQDISERKRYEQELQHMQDQLLKAQRIGHMGSWSQDLASGLFTWSPQTHVIHGTDPSEATLSLDRILSILLPEDAERVNRVYRQCIESGQPYDIRYRIRNPQRGVRHLHVRGEFECVDGQPARSVGMVLDETELVEAQLERDRLVSVLEATPDIVSMADLQGQVFYFNRAGYETLGLSPTTPLADVIARVHPEWAGRKVREEGIPAAIAQGQWMGETAVYDAQGRELPMSQMIVAHRSADGQVQYVSTILRNISERKATEATLRRQREQLAEAQAVAHIGSWSIEMPSGAVSWSDEHFRVLGYAPGSVAPSLEAYLDRVHPDDRAWVREHVERDMARQGGGVNRFEHRLLTPDGVRWVEERAGVETDGEGKVVRVYGTSMDITERVLASQAVVDLKDMLEQAETVSLLGSWAADAQTQRLNVSAQLFRNLGLEPSPHPPTEAQYLERIHPDDRAHVAADMQTIRDGGPPEDLVFRTNPEHGPVRWMRRTARRIDRDGDGLKPRYIGTLLDITESVQAEEKLRQTNHELEHRVAERTAQLSQANQELEAFSYSVSHDLKAPLRGIDGYSQLLVEEYGDKLNEEGRQFVRRIRHGVQQMGELISDLLEYSRMERRDMAAEKVAVRGLVQRILEGYEADIVRQQAQVQVEMDDFELALDREGMAVVLRNLIGNALKFSRDCKPPQIHIGSREDAGRRLLWVRDNGVGFDMRYHDRMFGIFQRLHRAEEFPGTGVGLALVAKAVQRMGGRVWAESAPGAGATFYLEFPT